MLGVFLLLGALALALAEHRPLAKFSEKLNNNPRYFFPPTATVKSVNAVARFRGQNGVTGDVFFDQDFYDGAPLRIYGVLRGLPSSGSPVSPSAMPTPPAGPIAQFLLHSPGEPLPREMFAHEREAADPALRDFWRPVWDEGDSVHRDRPSPPRASLHGLHVHRWGNLTGSHCGGTSSHFDPDWAQHGGSSGSARHVGDLGNVLNDIPFYIVAHKGSLFGRNSVLGRSLVVHAGADDLGRGRPARTSRFSGNAGRPVACAVVGRRDLVFFAPTR